MYSLMSMRDERVFAAEEEGRQGLCQVRLADAGRAEEQERAHRAVGILQPGPAAADRVRYGLDRLVLAHDTLVQHVLQTHELAHLTFHQAGHGHAGPA